MKGAVITAQLMNVISFIEPTFPVSRTIKLAFFFLNGIFQLLPTSWLILIIKTVTNLLGTVKLLWNFIFHIFNWIPCKIAHEDSKKTSRREIKGREWVRKNLIKSNNFVVNCVGSTVIKRHRIVFKYFIQCNNDVLH